MTQPGAAGYLVERSLFVGGPYEALTPDGLPMVTRRYESTGLAPGTRYYFRVRVFDGDGNLGDPSLPVNATPTAAGPPTAPQNLTADGGVTRVALAWDAPSSPVAGYFVYRRLDEETTWKRLNGTITPEPLYFDRFERGAFSQAKVFYRVQAIGPDNQAGAFSAEVAVTFGDDVPPPVPEITEASGTDGAAHLTFAPGAPEDDSTQFVVLRAEDEHVPGEVVGDTLIGSARSFDDADVTVGVPYWYEIVALDAAGNRSGVSNRVLVTVEAPALPAPSAPQATYHGAPFPYVELTLAAPPDKAQAIVEARAGGGKWRVVAGPVKDVTTINLTNLPPGAPSIDYRVVYRAANGARGEPSPVTEVTLR